MIIDASYGSTNIKPAMWAIDPGIVAYNASRMGLPMPKAVWWMPEGAGDRTCDYSGNLLDGTFSGTVLWQDGGLFLNNLGCVNIGDKVIGTSGISFFIQLKLNAVDDQGVVGKWSSGNYDYLFYISTTPRWRVYSGGAYHQITGSNTPTGRKFTYCVTYDGSYLNIYEDGVSIATPVAHTGTIDHDPAELFLGVYSGAFGAKLKGWMYSCVAFDRGLTPTQVATISADLYGLVRQPSMEELWAYVAAVGGVAPTGALYGPLVGPLGGPI